MPTYRFKTTNRMRQDDGGKRHRVVLRNGIEGFIVTTTAHCTGCTEYEMGAIVSGPSGCTECGHTGKRRRTHWEPFDVGEWARIEETRAINAIRTRAFYRFQGIGRIAQVVSIGRKRDIVVVAYYGGGIAKLSLTQFARDYLRMSIADVLEIARSAEGASSCSST